MPARLQWLIGDSGTLRSVNSPSKGLCLCTWAATTKSQRLEGLDKGNVFSQSPGEQVQSQGVGRLVSPEASPCGLHVASSLLCPHMAFPPCVQVDLSFPLFIKLPILSDQECIL